MRIATFAAVVVAAIGFLSVPVLAEGRVALVIGNSDYEAVARLHNPGNDATAMAETFKTLGFDDVRLELDLDYEGMRRALADFSRSAAGADIAIIYYAGHGIEVDGSNYLIPTDAALARADDVEFEAMSLDIALRALAPARRLKLFVLDACRDNPFVREMERTASTRSIGRGLARVEPASGDTLVAYAAREGTVAADGDGSNSPYAAALLRHISTPGLDVRLVFGRVRDDVLEATGGRQEPFIYGSLGGEQIYLAAAAADGEGGGTPPPAIGGAPRPSEAAEAWAAAKDTTSEAVLDAFIERFGDTFYADLARARLAELAEEEVAVGVFPPGDGGGAPEEPARNEFRDCDICPTMVEVPVGTFTMGSPAGERYRSESEGPQHAVTISRPFAAGKFEVTVDQYAAFVNETGRSTGSSCQINVNPNWEERRGLDFRNPNFAQGGDHPVVCVNWDDASAYAAWLTRRTGHKYRLLSEAEWEYSARAGSTGGYVYGDGDFRLCEFGNTSLDCDQQATTAPVGSYAANDFGLHDMHGNAEEWVADCHSQNYAGAPTDGSPWMSGNCQFHMRRGGSWYDHPANVRSAARSGMVSGNRIYTLGFRVATDTVGR